MVSFASNDYLGLTQHPAVVAAAHDALDRWGTGSGSARLIVGSRPVHSELEAALAEWKGTERAVLFTTGFAANLGVLTTFAGPDVLVCSDELNHASIIDGRRLSGAPLAVYRHGDVAHLDELLRRPEATGARSSSRRRCSRWTATSRRSTICSTLCARHGALLVLDEAHAVLGPPVESCEALLRVGTLSKTLGALGGFVAGPARYTDLLVNRARSYIFTTASTPADTAAALAALAVVRSPEGDELRARLRANVDRLRPGHPSPIVPYVCGGEQRALDVAAALLDAGLLVTAIRPPTVPPGTSRLRVTLSAAHTAEQVDRLACALARALPRMTRPERARVRRGHGHRGRQDVVDGRGRRTAARRTALPSRRASRCSRRHPVSDATPTCSPPPPREDPRHGVPRAPHLPPPVGTADGGGRAGARRRSPSTTSRPSSSGRRASRSGSSKASAGRAHRSPPTATTSTSHARSARTSSSWSPTPGSAPSTRCVCPRPAFDDFPLIVALNRFGDDPLHARNREFLVERADLDVVTAPAQLAARLRVRVN